MEKTLVLIKSDGVARGLVGRIISRFEDAGLKIVGSKFVWIDQDFAKKHYFDLEERKGSKIFKATTEYLVEGPVMALVLEGVDAIENVRRLTGATEPKSSAPGTIRGDFAHHSYGYTDTIGKSIRNLIHSSGEVKDAEYEIALWFDNEDLHEYINDSQKHTF